MLKRKKESYMQDLKSKSTQEVQDIWNDASREAERLREELAGLPAEDLEERAWIQSKIDAAEALEFAAFEEFFGRWPTPDHPEENE